MLKTRFKRDSATIKPFLKWAGGKTQLVNELASRLPQKIKKSGKLGCYIEPFIGGGAFFFYLSSMYKISKSIILDVNPEVIVAYTTVKNEPESLINKLSDFQNKYLGLTEAQRKDFYYEVRSQFNNSIETFDYSFYNSAWIDRTGQLIFLNKTCFNGLFRQNGKGEFNVPHGHYSNPSISKPQNILDCSEALKNTIIIKGDFSVSQEFIGEESFVYLDPPYRPLNKTASFTAYSKNGFDDWEQQRLAEFYKYMSSRGAYLLLSNSDPKNENPDDNFFDKLYKQFRIERVLASRMINCDATKRGSINELIVTNY